MATVPIALAVIAAICLLKLRAASLHIDTDLATLAAVTNGVDPAPPEDSRPADVIPLTDLPCYRDTLLDGLREGDWAVTRTVLRTLRSSTAEELWAHPDLAYDLATGLAASHRLLVVDSDRPGHRGFWTEQVRTRLPAADPASQTPGSGIP